MSMLVEVLLEIVESGVSASSERGLVSAFTAASVALLSVTMWVLVTSPEPLRNPSWAPVVLVGSLLVGGGGVFVSLLHLQRNISDRAFAVFCMIASGAAVAIPSLWLAVG
jgi:hypothetical protein